MKYPDRVFKKSTYKASHTKQQKKSILKGEFWT